MAKPKVTALAPAVRQQYLEAVETQADSFLQVLAKLASADLAPEELGKVLTATRYIEKTVKKGIEPALRTKIIALLKEQGEVTTEKGTRKLGPLTMRPHKSGVDSSRLEALLRAKEIKVEKYMLEVKTYKATDLGIQQLLSSGKITQEELTDCNYAESWTVMTPGEADE